jgi:L-alanine-DL-glutamate epimerase-like enolase superfamily enzyme
MKIRFSRGTLRDVGDGRTDPELVADVVRAVGERVPELDLMLDMTTELETFSDALRVGRACDEYGFVWYEDPLKDGGQSHRASRRLAENLETPLLMTELSAGVEHHANFVDAEATDLVRADPFYDGGITGAMKIARAAESDGLDVEYHTDRATCLQCAAATRNTNYVERTIDLDDDPSGYVDRLDDDGTVGMPTEPGVGQDLDWTGIEDRAVRYESFE